VVELEESLSIEVNLGVVGMEEEVGRKQGLGDQAHQPKLADILAKRLLYTQTPHPLLN